VFGSNTEGRHGKGFALTCKLRYGAIYGQAKGLQGQSYAIITKDLRKPNKGIRSVPLEMIKLQIVELFEFAEKNPDKEIIMTKIGTRNAGYTESEIENLFVDLKIPANVIMPSFGPRKFSSSKVLF